MIYFFFMLNSLTFQAFTGNWTNGTFDFRCSFAVLSWGVQYDYRSLALGIVTKGKVMLHLSGLDLVFYISIL